MNVRVSYHTHYTIMRIEAWIDGACDPNPGGHAGYGIVIKLNGEYMHIRSHYIGQGKGMSNNVAEYHALIYALTWNKARVPMKIYTDSKLVANQMNGRWRIKEGLYVPYARQAWNIMMTAVPHPFDIIWIDRERNKEADEVAKASLQWQIQNADY